MAFDISRPISSFAEEQQNRKQPQPPAFDWSSAKIVDGQDQRGLGTLLQDWAIEAASGAAGATKAIADAFGANNTVSQGLGKISELAQKELSRERQAEKFLQQKRMEAAEQSGDWWREAGAAIRNFAESPVAATASGAGSALPTVALSALPGGGVARFAAMGAGALQGAGAVKESIYERVEEEARKQGYSAQEAARMAEDAQAYSGNNFDQIALGAGLGIAAGGLGAERFIGGSKGVSGGILSRIAKGMAEEAVPEAFQGGQERLAANLAAQRGGFGGDTWTGVVGQGVTEGLASLGMGGATAAFKPAKADNGSGNHPPPLDPNAGMLSRAAIAAQQQNLPPALPAPGQLSGEAAMQMPDNSHDNGGNPLGVIEAMRRNMQLQQAREQAAQQAEDALARAFDSQAQHDAQRARFAPPEYERLDAQNGWEAGTAQRMHEYRNELAARGEENLTEAEAGVLAGLNEMFGTQAQPQAMQHAADTMPQQAALDARSAQHGEEAAAAQSTPQAADVVSRETANDAPQAGLSGAGATQDALTAAQVAGQDAQNVGQITAPTGQDAPATGQNAQNVGQSAPEVGQAPAPAAPTADLSEDARGMVEGGGAATRIITPDGKKLAAQWDVVEADEVQATLKEGVNQPRDRTRAASDAQVRAIAQNPDFDRLSDTSQTMDYGAPTLTREGVIVAGNGRFEGVSGAYAGDGQAAAQYRAQLEENAQRFGLDAQRIRGMKKPVLVRRVTQDADTRQLAVQSNQPAGLRMSDMEQAALDAERMGANLADLHIHEDGSIAPTQHNHEVIARALGGYTTEEAGEFMAADGGLSQAGLRRVRNAILYRAYGKSDVLTRLLEAPDADMRNVGTALLRAAGSLAENRRAMDENHIPAEYDIAADLEAAIAALSRIRASGQHVESFLAQSDWVGGGLSESGRTILRMVSENLRSAKAITQFLREYAARVQSLQNTSGGLFGDMPRPGKQEVLEDVKRRFDEQRNLARGQNDLFGQSADSARGDGGTATADGQDAKPAGVAGDARGAGSGAQAGADGRGVSGQPQAGQDEGTDGGAVVAENATTDAGTGRGQNVSPVVDKNQTAEGQTVSNPETVATGQPAGNAGQLPSDLIPARMWADKSKAGRLGTLFGARLGNEMDAEQMRALARQPWEQIEPRLQRRIYAAMLLGVDPKQRGGLEFTATLDAVSNGRESPEMARAFDAAFWTQGTDASASSGADVKTQSNTEAPNNQGVTGKTGENGGRESNTAKTEEQSAKTEEQSAKTEEQAAPSDWVGLTFAQAAEDWDGRGEAQRVKVLAAALRKNEMDLRTRMKTGRQSFAELDPALQRRVAAAMTLLRDKSERNGATVKQLMAQRAGKDLPQTPEARGKTEKQAREEREEARDAETGTSGGVIPGNGRNVEQGAAQGANLNQAEAVRKGNGQNLNQEAGEDARTPKERHAEEVASGRTVLDFHAWQKARSPQFKEWFGGDWETLHDLTVPEAATEEYALEELGKLAGRPLVNDDTGDIAYINGGQRRKIVSAVARAKSITNLKDEMDASEAVARHYAMAARIAELWKHAVYIGEFKDGNKEPGMHIYRFAVAVRQGGRVQYATILAKFDEKRQKDGSRRAYTLELHEEKTLQSMLDSLANERIKPQGAGVPVRSAEEILRATGEKINPPFLSQTNPTTGEPWGEIVKGGGQGERELAMPYAHRPLLQPEGRHEWQEYVREMRMALGEYKPIGGESMEEMFMKGDREARALFDEAYKKLAESGRFVPPGVRDRKLFNLAADLHYSNKAEQDALFAQVMAASQARQDRSKAAKFWDDALPQEREDMLTAALPNGSPRFKEFLAMPWEQVRAQLSPVSLVKGWRAMKAPQAAASTQRQGRTQKGIGNFGERISDNSKRVRLINYGSLTDIAERALSDIWPLDSVREIEDTFLAAVAHAARAAIPAKPKNEYKVGVWAEHVRDALRMAKDAARLELDVDGFRQYAEHGKFYFMDNVADKVELLTNIDRAFWGGVEEVRLFKGETGIDARVRLSGSRERQSIQGKDIADIASQVSDRLAAHLAKEKPRGKRDVSFEVVRARGKTIIQARGSYAALKEFEGATQEAEREAQAYIDAHHDELLAEWERFNTRDGRDVREGKDATPEMFSQAFGFRGVEFGRATGQKERQTLLNRAFDALHDLADLLGVPTQALSLNGSLGLAFGSRGRGNASAHFEPDSLVINLTRERGAGTLAHEWFHALDNYFSRMRGVRYGSMTKMKEGDAAGNVRAEMVKAFNKLVMALNASPMAKRSRELDDSLGTRRYFTRPEERAARAFENYVIAKMQAQGIRNNYLAYVLPEYRSREGQYPYLLAEEVAPIEKAFDNLFAKVKTKQTDKGVALFARSRAASGKTTAGQNADTARDAAGRDGYYPAGEKTNAQARDAQVRELARAEGISEDEARARIEQAQREFAQTQRAYGGKAAYDAAKKAGKTKLNYRQWVQVRMPAFKAWFGDWEAKRGVRMLEEQTPLDLGEAPATAQDFHARKAAVKDALRALREQGEKENRHDGRSARFVANVAGKIAGHTGFDAARVAGEFGRLFETAVPMTSEPEEVRAGHKEHTSNMVGFSHYVNRFQAGGKTYYVRFTVQQMAGKDGDIGEGQVHSSFISEVDIYAGHEKSAGLTTASTRVSDPYSTAAERFDGNVAQQAEEGKKNLPPVDKKLAAWLEAGRTGEVSAVTDPETGEPMVVYHATDQDFTVFDRARAGEVTDANATSEAASQMARLGFWFSDHDIRENIAADFVKESWLNIRNVHKTSFDELWNELENQTAQEFADDNLDSFDGIVLDDSEFGGISFVAFDPTQIKSATDNLGLFGQRNPDTRFAREEAAGAPSRGRFALAAGGVRRVVRQALQGVGNAPRVEVVETVADLPFAAPSDAQGAFHNGRVWLVAENLKSAQEAREVLAHEMIGHYGLRGFFGRGLDMVLNRIHRNSVRVQRMSYEWRRDNADLIRTLEARGVSREAIRARSIEEALAQMAQAGEKLNGWKMLAGFVQNLLRKIGAHRWANMLEARTDAEALTALKQAEMFVRDGLTANDTIPNGALAAFEKAAQAQTAFSREEAAAFGATPEELQAEYDAVVRRYKGTPQWMKAPNGEPTKLTERQWVQVRTPRFKAWFGNWELPHKEFAIVEAQSAPFNNRDAALQWAKDNGILGTMTHEETGGKGELSISKSAVREMLNPKQRDKSASRAVHYAVLTKIKEIIRESDVVDTHPDYRKGEDGQRSPQAGINPGVKIEVMYGALRFGGKVYRVKTTVKRFADKNAKDKANAYHVEDVEIEGLAGQGLGNDANATPPSTSPSEDATNNSRVSGDILLRGVRQVNQKTGEPGALALGGFSAAVGEDGEPLVVYHGSRWNPLAEAPGKAVFRHDAVRNASEGVGFYFTAARELAQGWGEAGGYFLNIRKPANARAQLQMSDKALRGKLREVVDILRGKGYDFYEQIETDLLDTLSSETVESALDYLLDAQGFVDGEVDSEQFITDLRKAEAEVFGVDGYHSPDYSDGKGVFVAFDPTQIKSATHNTGAFDGDERDIRFSFAGERGAQSLDAAEEVTHRMDNLAVAREMEEAGKDTKTVKLATGWERGADGKWRYEIDDNYNTFHAGGDAVARRDWPGYAEDVDRIRALLNKKENAMLFDTAPLTEAEARELAELQEKRRADIEHWRRRMEKGNARLMDVLDAPELFRAYPQLENVAVDFADLPHGGATGSITPDGKNITLARWLDLHNKETVLHHEIQHAIQIIEGFAPGVNPVSAYSGETAPHAFKELERLRKEVGTPRTREQYAQEAGWDAADVGTQEFEEAYRDYVKTVREAARGKASDRAMQETAARNVYHRTAGEVEARNVQSRLGMTAEQRRATLAEETEDVAREDQIVLQEMLGEVQESRSAQKSVTANIARGQAAMNRALLEKADQHRAMFRTGLGWVDFVWGDARKGVAHIIEERQAKDGITREETARMLMEKVVPAIARGEETRRFEKDGAVRVYIEHEGVRASLVRQPGSNAWLLTAFELNTPHPAGRGATPAADTAAAPTRTRRNGGGVSPAGNGAGTASIAQRDGDSQSPSNTKGSGAMFARWKREKDAGRTDLNYPAWLDAQKQDGSQDDAPLFARGGSAAAAAPSGNNGAPSQQAVNAFGNITAEQEAALRATGLLRSPKTLRQRFAELTDNLGKRLVQGLVDQYAPLKELDFRAYVLARMSKGTDGTFEALLHYGTPKVRGDTLEVDTSTGGLMQVLSELDGEQDRFLAWIAANRAEKLSQEGREFLFTPEQIQHLKALNQGTMKDGTSRAMRYAATLRKFNDFQDAVLAIAEARGLIDAESRAVWRNGFYVPFYRNMEDGTTGASVRSGLVNQYAFKKLKGSRRQLNEDLLANTLQNMAHLLSAAAKNQAASAALRAADSAGVAHRVPSGTKGSVRFLDNGREVHYLVDDPFVFDAITSLESVKVAGLEKVLSKFKHMLTFGVTINPTFQLRSLIRDALQSMAITNIGMNPLANVKQGIASQLKKDQDYINALASGGLIRFNSLLEGNRADYTRRLIRKGVKDSTILDTPEKIRNFFETAVDKWLAVGDISESTNRMALYKQLVAQGVDPLLAAYQARDLMDFSMQGQWRAVRFLTQVVPFLNARMQGLYKLGRDGVMPTARVLFGQGSATDKQIARRFGAVTGAVALASIALMAAYEDDDDWKRREDWDRDTYWWFKLGGTAYRIPKPFEVGAIGTVAERTAELLMSDEMTGRRFLSRMGHMASDTFSLNPIPQAVKPLLDVYANKDSFTGRPIESMGMERLRPEDRYTGSTSELAKWLGQIGLPDPSRALAGEYRALSPVQIDALIRGYFSWLGVSATRMVDEGVRAVAERPARPAMQLRDVFFAGNFVEKLPSNNSRYLTALYDQASAVESAWASYRFAQKQGDTERVRELLASDGDKIRLRPAVNQAKNALNKLNANLRAIERDPHLSAEEKRARIDRIKLLQHNIARRAVQALR